MFVAFFNTACNNGLHGFKIRIFSCFDFLTIKSELKLLEFQGTKISLSQFSPFLVEKSKLKSVYFPFRKTDFSLESQKSHDLLSNLFGQWMASVNCLWLLSFCFHAKQVACLPPFCKLFVPHDWTSQQSRISFSSAVATVCSKVATISAQCHLPCYVTSWNVEWQNFELEMSKKEAKNLQVTGNRCDLSDLISSISYAAEDTQFIADG